MKDGWNKVSRLDAVRESITNYEYRNKAKQRYADHEDRHIYHSEDGHLPTAEIEVCGAMRRHGLPLGHEEPKLTRKALARCRQWLRIARARMVDEMDDVWNAVTDTRYEDGNRRGCKNSQVDADVSMDIHVPRGHVACEPDKLVRSKVIRIGKRGGMASS